MSRRVPAAKPKTASRINNATARCGTAISTPPTFVHGLFFSSIPIISDLLGHPLSRSSPLAPSLCCCWEVFSLTIATFHCRPSLIDVEPAWVDTRQLLEGDLPLTNPCFLETLGQSIRAWTFSVHTVALEGHRHHLGPHDRVLSLKHSCASLCIKRLSTT